MTIDSLLKCAKSAYKPFDSNGTERKNLVCETLLAHFLGKNRVFLHTHSDKKIQDILCKSALCHSKRNASKRSEESKKLDCHDLASAKSRNDNTNQPVIAREQSDQSNPLLQAIDSPQNLKSKLLAAISRLNDGYPLEYITKKVSFYSQDFFIDCGALIPRTETELLVDKATQLIAKHNIRKIYEIGTGSGIIAIMLCLQNPHITITATDISPTALKIAQKNIALKSTLDSSLKSRITLVESDLLNGVDFNPKDSLIISNPPYIAESYAIPCNLSFEPPIALFGGKNGDEILQKIIALDSDFLCCEIGYNQGYLADFLSAYKSVEFYKDYADFMRGFVASKV